MARNKIGLHFDGWEEYMAKLDEIGSGEAMKRGVEEALKASKEYVNSVLEQKVTEAKLPAKGKYSTGETKRSLDSGMEVEWSAMTGEIKVGFDMKKSGLTSIFLMYGTPRMKPVAGLKSAIYGTKTKKAIQSIQEEAMKKVIDQIME